MEFQIDREIGIRNMQVAVTENDSLPSNLAEVRPKRGNATDDALRRVLGGAQRCATPTIEAFAAEAQMPQASYREVLQLAEELGFAICESSCGMTTSESDPAQNPVMLPMDCIFKGLENDCEELSEDKVRSLETALLLNEIRIDALRAAGLHDQYNELCLQALQKVGTLQFHNRVFNKFLFEANLACVQGISNVPTLERLRGDIEAVAAVDYEERFGAAPQQVAALNIRSACCDGVWQAVVASDDSTRIWYRVEIVDDEFELEYLEDCDIELDDRFTVIADISK